MSILMIVILMVAAAVKWAAHETDSPEGQMDMWFARGYFEEQASRMFARAAFWAIVSLQGLIAISGIGQTILYFQRLELDQSLSDTRLSERNSSVQVLHWSQQYRAPRPDPASKTFLSKFLDPLQLLSLCEIRPLNCFRCGCFGQNGSYLARTSSTWHEVNPLQNKSLSEIDMGTVYISRESGDEKSF